MNSKQFDSTRLSRRTLLQLSSLTLCPFALGEPFLSATAMAAAQEEKSLPPLNRFPRMVQDYYQA